MTRLEGPTVCQRRQAGALREGDAVIVRKHVGALAYASDVLTVGSYRVLGRSAVEPSRRLGLDADHATELERSLARTQG
jgi:hypothetical protein